jgi:hypothetical protein
VERASYLAGRYPGVNARDFRLRGAMQDAPKTPPSTARIPVLVFSVFVIASS